MHWNNMALQNNQENSNYLQNKQLPWDDISSESSSISDNSMAMKIIDENQNDPIPITVSNPTPTKTMLARTDSILENLKMFWTFIPRNYNNKMVNSKIYSHPELKMPLNTLPVGFKDEVDLESPGSHAQSASLHITSCTSSRFSSESSALNAIGPVASKYAYKRIS